MKLVLATRNQGKVQELTEMLDYIYQHSAVKTANQQPRKVNGSIEVVSLKSYPGAPEIDEDGETYAENACKKASAIAQYTGHLTLADDAGLEVSALNGAPGVNSKRWAGEDATDEERVARLLQILDRIKARRARFVAAIAVAHPDTVPEVVMGICEGRIAHSPAGESGFGYDPIFVPDGYEQSFAELGEKIKNQISHRAKALQQALALIE